MLCKVCRQEITDEQGATPFVSGGKTRFWVHPFCATKVVEGGAIIGNTVKQLVELRNPGLFQKPLVRGLMAVIREFRK